MVQTKLNKKGICENNFCLCYAVNKKSNCVNSNVEKEGMQTRCPYFNYNKRKKEPVEKWSVNTFFVETNNDKDREAYHTKIGGIYKIVSKNNTDQINFLGENNLQTRMMLTYNNNFNHLKWFATEKEARKFSKTLKEDEQVELDSFEPKTATEAVMMEKRKEKIAIECLTWFEFEKVKKILNYDIFHKKSCYTFSYICLENSFPKCWRIYKKDVIKYGYKIIAADQWLKEQERGKDVILPLHIDDNVQPDFTQNKKVKKLYNKLFNNEKEQEKKILFTSGYGGGKTTQFEKHIKHCEEWNGEPKFAINSEHLINTLKQKEENKTEKCSLIKPMKIKFNFKEVLK